MSDQFSCRVVERVAVSISFSQVLSSVLDRVKEEAGDRLLLSSLAISPFSSRFLRPLSSLIEGAATADQSSIAAAAAQRRRRWLLRMNGNPSAPECVCRRWVVSVQKTLENDQLEAQYRRAIQSIAADEYERIPKFRFKDDALQSLIGRLLLRQATRLFSGAEWHEISFGRTDRGKPYLLTPEGAKFGLNISHQGDLVAFASSCAGLVGVDCMRLDKDRNNKTADEYITSVAKSASPEELRMMRSQPTDPMKMVMFYRYWCLKEALCKATGEGIPNDLGKLDFRINTNDRYRQGCFVTSTTVLDNGVPQDKWIFEETFVGANHSAAVCREKKTPRHCLYSIEPDEGRIFFNYVDMERLLNGSTIVNPMEGGGADEWAEFDAKPRKPF